MHRPSTDNQAREVADGQRDSFAAWHVEDRTDAQLLMCDMAGRTRSWFMVEQTDRGDGTATRLLFGSAVLSRAAPGGAKPKPGGGFKSLLAFHRLYSRVLLSSAGSRVTATIPRNRFSKTN